MIHETPELTQKAQHTRQHILDTALALFVTNGYEATTMRDIANAADCSLGLTYRYFARKEELVLGLYRQMAADTGAQIEMLPAVSVAERFYRLMKVRLEQARRYRESFRALFAAAMNSASRINILGQDSAEMHREVNRGFKILVIDAVDAPPNMLSDDLAILLYGVHFGVILFWLYDRTPDQRATAQLLALIRDLLGIGRRVLGFPFVRHGLARAARITDTFFAGQ